VREAFNKNSLFNNLFNMNGEQNKMSGCVDGRHFSIRRESRTILGRSARLDRDDPLSASFPTSESRGARLVRRTGIIGSHESNRLHVRRVPDATTLFTDQKPSSLSPRAMVARGLPQRLRITYASAPMDEDSSLMAALGGGARALGCHHITFTESKIEYKSLYFFRTNR
jgi:hypothetical protein